ncbi:MAG: intradiol ring-cleavage dioxygenase [Rhodobacter sp.]|nr:intradiol ring-cleavage dioxygenase [Rhodobacter sp.]MCA3499840.1 intradiol ring-cleavage dioxygenase [Rhodobacter sp.]MCA3517823.1 intradiol ring-cleavage dioxygenase [Rhodobacter sp.]
MTNDLTRTRPEGRAEGRHILISGRVMDVAGRPLAGAVVEIWSVNARNIYLVEDGGASDPDFAGFGMTETDGEGRYSFKTIRPGGYDRYLGLIRRTAHIHVLVKVAGAEAFTTEMWFADEPRNSIDSFFQRVSDPGLQDRMAVILSRGEGVDRAQFDLVLAPQYAGRGRS